MGNITSSSELMRVCRRRTWPLALILAARFALVAAIPLAAFALAIVFHVVPSVRHDVDHHHEAMASAVVTQVESYFAVADRELRTLSVLLGSGVLTATDITKLLDAYVSATDFYEAIYLADPQGHVAAIGLPPETAASRRNYVGLDVGQRDFVREAWRRQAPVWSNSFLSPVSLRLAIAIAVPVGERMLIGEVAVTPLPAFARKLTLGSSLTVMMLDRQNHLTAHSENTHANQQLNLGQLPMVAPARSGQRGVQTEFEFDGRHLVGSAWPVAGLDWLVVVTQPRQVAYAQLDETWTRLLVAAAAALMAALTGAVWTSGVVSRRFQSYNRQAQAIADGRYDVAGEDSGTREFNQLRDNLQRMGVAIREREELMRQAQVELQFSEQRLLATIEQTPNVAVQWYDGDGRVVMWNRASEQIYGIPREQAVGSTLDQLAFTEAQAAAFTAVLADAAQIAPVGPYESGFIRPDGSAGDLLCTTFDIPGEAGSPCFVCMAIDITEQKRAERSLLELNATLEERVKERTDELTRANEELVQALDTLQKAQSELFRTEKLAALGSMVAGIAHELNTPIGNCMLAVTALDSHNATFRGEFEAGNLRRSSLERHLKDSRTATDILLRNLQRASELLRSFKQVAVDQTSAQRRTFRLDQLIDEILLTMQPTLKTRPLAVVTDIEAEIWFDSYPGPLGQIVTNLVNNAVIHAFAGRTEGSIRLIGRRIATDQVEFAVDDDGNGIAPRHLGRVFDPFFTTRLGQGGSGLGLSIAHTLATRVLGGHIRVESTLGVGTRFTLELPRCAPMARDEEKKAAPQEPVGLDSAVRVS